MNDTMQKVDAEETAHNVKRKYRKPWTDAELAQIWDGKAHEVARKLGRTAAAVNWQRFENRKNTGENGVPKYNAPAETIEAFEERLDFSGMVPTVVEGTDEIVASSFQIKEDLKSFLPGFGFFSKENDEVGEVDEQKEEFILKIKFGEKVIEFNQVPKKISIFGVEIEF